MPTVSDNWKKLALQKLWVDAHTPDGLVVIADSAITDENVLETLNRALS